MTLSEPTDGSTLVGRSWESRFGPPLPSPVGDVGRPRDWYPWRCRLGGSVVPVDRVCVVLRLHRSRYRWWRHVRQCVLVGVGSDALRGTTSGSRRPV